MISSGNLRNLALATAITAIIIFIVLKLLKGVIMPDLPAEVLGEPVPFRLVVNGVFGGQPFALDEVVFCEPYTSRGDISTQPRVSYKTSRKAFGFYLDDGRPIFVGVPEICKRIPLLARRAADPGKKETILRRYDLTPIIYTLDDLEAPSYLDMYLHYGNDDGGDLILNSSYADFSIVPSTKGSGRKFFDEKVNPLNVEKQRRWYAHLLMPVDYTESTPTADNELLKIQLDASEASLKHWKKWAGYWGQLSATRIVWSPDGNDLNKKDDYLEAKDTLKDIVPLDVIGDHALAAVDRQAYGENTLVFRFKRSTRTARTIFSESKQATLVLDGEIYRVPNDEPLPEEGRLAVRRVGDGKYFNFYRSALGAFR